MKIISSQRYIDQETVTEKEKELAGCDKVEIPCSEVGEIDGIEYAIVVDKHHTMEAAKELGIEIVFEINQDSEGLTGNNLLEVRWIDSPYYDINTGIDEW